MSVMLPRVTMALLPLAPGLTA